MQIRTLLGIAAAMALAPAFGQTLGSVASVNGVVTVTTSSGGTTLAPGAPLVHGSRIVTTSASSATLSVNNGCIVSVPPSHGVTLLSGLTCQQLQASVKPVLPVAANQPTTAVMGQSSGAGGFGGNAVALAWGIGIALTAVYDATNDNDTTPVSGR